MTADEITAAFARQWWDAKEASFFSRRFRGLSRLQHPFDARAAQEIIYETLDRK